VPKNLVELGAHRCSALRPSTDVMTDAPSTFGAALDTAKDAGRQRVIADDGRLVKAETST